MKKNKIRPRFSLLAGLIFIFLYHPISFGFRTNGFFDNWENSWQDFLFRWDAAHLRPGDPKIVIAAIDDASLHHYGYPLPRIVYARLLDKLKKYGVKTAVFDVLFFEPRAHDQALIAATRRFKRTIHLYSFEIVQTAKGRLVRITPPIAGLTQASQFLGYPDIADTLDPDGHIRKFKLFNPRVTDPKTHQIGASLEAPAYASFTGTPLKTLVQKYATPHPQALFINFRAPIYPLNVLKTRSSRALLSPQPYYPHPAFSIEKILKGKLTGLEKNQLQGALVLIGSTALGSYDHYPSPFTGTNPGVEFHANILDNLLHRDWLRPLPALGTILFIFFMIWVPLLLGNFAPPVSAAVAFLILCAWAFFANWEFLRGTRVEFVAPALALLVSFVAQTIYQALDEGREKKFIKNLFAQFVSPEVVNDLARHPDKIKLGGEKKDMSVLFLDIANFTGISEKMRPEDLISFLNRYLSAFSLVIHQREGVVDKYIGDCVMAFWNAPFEVKNHRAEACLAALELQDAVAKLNQAIEIPLPETPTIRIGVNSGEVTVGLTGSQTKLQYTVIGDEVNLASRLEGANKFFGSKILASESAYLGARETVEARELGLLRVIGKSAPVRAYEILARRGELSKDWKKALPLYQKALGEIRGENYQEALISFESVLEIIAQDVASQFYIAACKTHLAHPQSPWDGIINLAAK